MSGNAFAGVRHRRAFPVTALGILWGIALSAMESVSLPVREESAAGLASLMLGNIVVWSSIGVAIAWGVDWAGARLRDPWFLVGALTIGALALGSVASLLIAVVGQIAPEIGVRAVFPNGSESLASFLYQAWLILFYGGFYVLARTFGQRAESTRAMLADAQIARVKSEMALKDAELRALRGRVDPRFLLRIMEEVDHRYRATPQDADRLLNLLIDMLRQAMPGVRTGHSTLSAEVALARAHCALMSELAPAATTWSIDVADQSEEVPFPTMLIVPLIERLGSPRDADRSGHVAVRRVADTFVVDFHRKGVSAAACVPEDDQYRIRVALSTLSRDRWSLEVHGMDGASPDVRITLALDSFQPTRVAPTLDFST